MRLAWRILLRRSPARWATPLLAAVLLVSWYVTSTRNVRMWVEVSFGLTYAMVLAGPLAAGVGAFVAGQERRAGLGELMRSAPRPLGQGRLLALGSSLTWSLVAFAVVAVGVSAWVATGATWGGPDLWALAQAAAALGAFTALGFVVGSGAPSRLVVPLVVAAAYYLQFFVATRSTWPRALVPTSQEAAPLIWGYDPGQSRAQGVWYLAVIFWSGVVVSIGAVRRRIWQATGVTLAATVLVGSVLGVAEAYGGGDSRRSRPMPLACDQGVPQVCVHPAFQALLPDLGARLREVSAPLAGVPGAPRQFVQAPTVGGGTDDVVPFPVARLDNRIDVNFLVVLAVTSLVGDQCSAGGVSGGRQVPADQARGQLAAWLLAQGGLPTGWSPYGGADATALASWSPERRGEWLRTNLAKLRACSADVQPAA